jgi:hypothetical protein
MHLRLTALLLSVVLLFTGCTTFHAVPFPPDATHQLALQVGDYVRLRCQDGSRVELRIERIQADALAGQGRTVKYADIRQVEVRRINKAGTVLVVAGIVVGVVVLAGVIILATGNFAVMTGGPA